MRKLPGLALLAVTFLFCLPSFAQVFQNDGNTPDTSLGTSGVRRNRYPMTGDVHDSISNAPLVRVQVTVRSDDNQTYLATLTDESGRFSFDNLPRANYTVSVSIIGYQIAEERVVVQDGPALGVQLRPHANNSPAATEDTRPAISAHELSAPSKAREDMVKGEKLLFEKSDFQGSIREFEKAIKEFPDYFEAYSEMGLAYIGSKDPAKAEAALRKSIALSDEKYARPFVYLATLFSDNQRFSDAEPMARKAIELDGNSWQAYHELTRAQVGLNRLPEAEQSAQAAVKLAPEEPELYLTLINIEGKLPNYPAMLSSMNTYLRVAPNGRAADQVRTMRDRVQEALAKAPSDSPRAEPADSSSKP